MTPTHTPRFTLLTVVLALAACDTSYDELDGAPTVQRKLPMPAELEPEPEPLPPPSLACDPGLDASVGGLYYPADWDCASAIADAETNLGSYHYRNACNQQVGSDIGEPVDDAVVASCQVDPSGQILVTVDLCCSEPAFSCDPDLFASVGGIYYPGWTCADAIADAEASLGSYHYRNACNDQVGSDIGDPVGDASVVSCNLDPYTNDPVVTVDLCCAEPAFSCDPDLFASVGGIYYPGWTCADAIADAEASLGSYHYRNACNDQVGSDIGDPVGNASVVSCDLDPYTSDPVVTVDLCCAEPAFVCDPALSASVGGIYYPGWTCADAIADAEASLGSYHYRNACNDQVGSDIDTPVQQASVVSCDLDPYTGDPVITADLCCS